MSAEQMLLMRQLGGGLLAGGSAWVQVVFLAFLLWVPVFRPERIRIVSLFRRAYVCFALSVIIPSTAPLLVAAVMGPAGLGGRAGGGFSGALFSNGALQLLTAMGPVLFGISLICALGAVVPSFIPPPSSRPSARSYDVDSSAGDDSSGDGFSAESKSP